MTKMEAFLFASCLLFMSAFMFTAVFWLVILEGYKIFIDGLPSYHHVRTMMPDRRQIERKIGPYDHLIYSNFDDFKSKSNQNTSEFCVTPQCARIAGLFLGNINMQVQPCDDFHEFVCGNYDRDRNIPPNKVMRDTIGDMETRVDKQLKSALEAPIDDDKDSALDIISKQFYQRCLDADRLASVELQHVKDEITHAGGWPLFHDMDDRIRPKQNVQSEHESDQNITWEHFIGHLLNKHAVNGFLFNFAVTKDERNNSRPVLEIDLGDLGMQNHESYLDESNGDPLELYIELMTATALALGYLSFCEHWIVFVNPPTTKRELRIDLMCILIYVP